MSAPFSAGTVFTDRYRVERVIKSGGMGTVYEVTHLATGRRLALKTMRAEAIGDPKLVKRFVEEAQISGRIESRHVVSITDAGVHDGSPFIVMELLRGQDLGEVLAGRRLTWEETAVVATHVARGLDRAHRANVVHRDLKPENIFLSRGEDDELVVKILDFGIAKWLEGATATTLTGGTPLYMAPEQLDKAPITPATDIWAFGLVIFRALTGRAYWEADSVATLYTEVLFATLPPASDRAPPSTLPSGFDDWFARAVAREPSERFQTVAEAAAELAKLLPVTSSAPSPRGAARGRGHAGRHPHHAVPTRDARAGRTSRGHARVGHRTNAADARVLRPAALHVAGARVRGTGDGARGVAVAAWSFWDRGVRPGAGERHGHRVEHCGLRRRASAAPPASAIVTLSTASASCDERRG
ncbi:MAG: serine/threonine-protein kinase [Polyangiaceae bacterium]